MFDTNSGQMRGNLTIFTSLHRHNFTSLHPTTRCSEWKKEKQEDDYWVSLSKLHHTYEQPLQPSTTWTLPNHTTNTFKYLCNKWLLLLIPLLDQKNIAHKWPSINKHITRGCNYTPVIWQLSKKLQSSFNWRENT